VNPTAPLAEVEPALKLADLLHACVCQAARNGDFASLFQKAQSLQAGWDLDGGQIIIGRQFDVMGNIDMYRPPCGQLGYSFEMPPYPNVHIARNPYAVLDSMLLIEKRVRSVSLNDPKSEVHWRKATCFDAGRSPGRLIAYRDLYLAAAKVNADEIGAAFFERCGVDVQVNNLGPQFPAYPTGAFDMGNFQGAGFIVPEIYRDGWQRVMVHRDVDINLNWISREPGSERDPLHCEYPEDGVCYLEFAPVDTEHVEDWLCRNKSLRGPDGELLASVSSPFAKRGCNPVTTWNCDTASVACHVENAIHSGAIEASLSAWTDLFRALIEAHAKGWRVAAAKDEEKLRPLAC